MKSRRSPTTTARFPFESLPPEALCEIISRHADYAPFRFFASTASNPPSLAYDGRPLLKSPLDVVLRPARTVLVLVTDEKGAPIPGVHVLARRANFDGTLSSGESDKNGAVRLKLPPGEYTLEGRPPKGVNFVVTSHPLTVEESPDTQSNTLHMDAGCILILTAIDANTRAGIPGVDFWFEQTERVPGRPGMARMMVQSTTSSVENPVTDANGTLMAVVRPGTQRYGIGFGRVPNDYEVVNPDDKTLGRILQLPAGGILTEEFLLRKTGK